MAKPRSNSHFPLLFLLPLLPVNFFPDLDALEQSYPPCRRVTSSDEANCASLNSGPFVQRVATRDNQNKTESTARGAFFLLISVWWGSKFSEFERGRAFQPVTERRQHLTKIDLPGCCWIFLFQLPFSARLSTHTHTHPAWKSVKKIHSFLVVVVAERIFPLFPLRKSLPKFQEKISITFPALELRFFFLSLTAFWH